MEMSDLMTFRPSPAAILACVLALLCVGACGDAPPDVPNNDAKPLLPLAVGSKWTFKVTSSAGVVIDNKIQSVTGSTTVDGAQAFRLLTERAFDRGTRSVQMIKDGKLVRVSEEGIEAGQVSARFRFDPYGLRIDSTRTTAGAEYTDEHTKIEVDENGQEVARVEKVHDFKIESAAEIVTVPAGTFTCVRVRRERGSGGAKTYWYAPGVGKVKETGLQTEELIEVKLAGE